LASEHFSAVSIAPAALFVLEARPQKSILFPYTTLFRSIITIDGRSKQAMTPMVDSDRIHVYPAKIPDRVNASSRCVSNSQIKAGTTPTHQLSANYPFRRT